MKWISYVYAYISLPSHLQVSTEHQAEFPVLYSGFPLAIYFTHGSVHMLIPISQFIPPLFPRGSFFNVTFQK